MRIIKVMILFSLLIHTSSIIAENDETLFTQDSNIVKTDTTLLIADTTISDTTTIVNKEKELSFWTKYIEPTIAVLCAATVTTLLFFVRSK